MRRILVAALVAPFLVLPAAAPASAACARVASDFNGDGYGDLAVGAPHTHEPVGDVYWAGALHVAYGSATGLAKGGTKSATITRRTPGIPDLKFPDGLRLGESLASGYFDGDCYADLAVSAAAASAFLLLYGSPSGLTTDRSAAFDGTTIEPNGASGTAFSHDLAAGDFNGDGFDDIASGAPYNDRDSGAFGVLYGSSGGVTGTGAQWISQNSPNVPGAAEPEDYFGWSLAAGDFNGDGRSELAVGAPAESLGSRYDAGGVIVFAGTMGGLTTTGSKWWDQDSAGVPEVAERFDRFGDQLVAGDVNGDRRAELIVGVPGESVGKQNGAGMVNTFRGSASGLVPGSGFHQDDPKIPGAAERGDAFGSAVALADLNRDGKKDLAIGVRSETVGTVDNTGGVNIVYGTAAGLSATGAGYLDQNSAGVPGANEEYDGFGSYLSRVQNAYGGDALAVTARDETVAQLTEGAVTVIPSAAKGAARPTSYFFSGANFPGGSSEHAGFGMGLS
jgi:hypothetical protein